MSPPPSPLDCFLLLLYPAAVWTVSELSGANLVIRDLQSRWRYLYPIRWAGLILILAGVGMAFLDQRVLALMAAGLSGWMIWRGALLMRWGQSCRKPKPDLEGLKTLPLSPRRLCLGGGFLMILGLAALGLWGVVLTPRLFP